MLTFSLPVASSARPKRTPVRTLARNFILGLLSLSSLAAAEAAPSALQISGDLRLRYEWDWDSRNGAGVPRTDRDRARMRARIGAGYKLSDEWSFGARVRTGHPDSQQSSHLTFSSSDQTRDDLDGAFDRYFAQFKHGDFLGWAGRNSSPFWQQNEMVWDEDVTPTGVAVSYDYRTAHGTLTTTGGFFALPDGMRHLHGRLAAAQAKYVLPLKPSQLTFAGTLYRFDGENGARFLRNRNGARDYLIGVASAQWSAPVGGKPLTLGVDVIKNFQDYSAAEIAPFPAAQSDETNGYVVSAQFGQLKQARDWLVGYSYAQIETFAVNASFAQDDWARFGSATQSDLTDIKGHEVRVAYAITKNISLVSRWFLVEAITSVQDGKRLRIDLNWKF